MKEISETIGHITGDDGAVAHRGVWKSKNQYTANKKTNVPMALKDKQGNMITNPEGIKKICLEEMLERLRNRKIHPDFTELQSLKEILCNKRLELARHMKSDPWTMKELNVMLKSLQKKKCRDPQGYINELFQNESAGIDLRKSLLHMLNKVKETLEIPECMTNVNIVMLPKPGKNSLHEVQNQRGIFLLSIFRTMVMKMLPKDEYNKIDNFMSDANAGGRKGRRVQDHLFIINGIIYDHALSKSEKQITICIYDCECCFDSLWQDEVLNDLYEAGIKDDKLSLLQKIYDTNRIAVKTHGGLSQRKVVNKIICQG